MSRCRDFEGGPAANISPETHSHPDFNALKNSSGGDDSAHFKNCSVSEQKSSRDENFGAGEAGSDSVWLAL